MLSAGISFPSQHPDSCGGYREASTPAGNIRLVLRSPVAIAFSAVAGAQLHLIANPFVQSSDRVRRTCREGIATSVIYILEVFADLCPSNAIVVWAL